MIDHDEEAFSFLSLSNLKNESKWMSQAAGKAGMVSVKWDNGNYGYYRWSDCALCQIPNLKGWELGTSMS